MQRFLLSSDQERSLFLHDQQEKLIAQRKYLFERQQRLEEERKHLAALQEKLAKDAQNLQPS